MNNSMYFEISLNPLNQVYVFNLSPLHRRHRQALESLNPLNQVYVFNVAIDQIKETTTTLWVLIP